MCSQCSFAFVVCTDYCTEFHEHYCCTNHTQIRSTQEKQFDIVHTWGVVTPPLKGNLGHLYVSVGCLEHISADFPTIIVRLNRFPEPSAYEEAGSSIWPIQVTFVGPYAMSTKPVSRKITRTGVWEFGHLTRSGDIEAATSRRILKGEFTNSFLSRREERDRRATSTFKPSNKQ